MSNDLSKYLPASISKIIQLFNENRLPSLIKESVWKIDNRKRALRSDFLAHVKHVLLFLVQHYDIRTRQILMPISPTEATTVSVGMISYRTGLVEKTITRVLGYLEIAGILTKERTQPRYAIPNPNGFWLVVRPKARFLTDKLWTVCGLLDDLIKDRNAKNNSALKHLTVSSQEKRKLILKPYKAKEKVARVLGRPKPILPPTGGFNAMEYLRSKGILVGQS